MIFRRMSYLVAVIATGLLASLSSHVSAQDPEDGQPEEEAPCRFCHYSSCSEYTAPNFEWVHSEGNSGAPPSLGRKFNHSSPTACLYVPYSMESCPHPSCGDSEEEEAVALALLRSEDYIGLAQLVAFGDHVELNRDRLALQVIGCNDAVGLHLPLSESQHLAISNVLMKVTVMESIQLPTESQRAMELLPSFVALGQMMRTRRR